MDAHAGQHGMGVLLQRMLKVIVQPEKLTRNGLYSIAVQQVEARQLIEMAPGMHPFLPGLYDAAYAEARRLAPVETGHRAQPVPD